MRTIAAGEIKRRGISAVDEGLEEGPVHVIKGDQLRYVVIREEHYRAFLEAQEEAQIARVRAALADIVAGRTRRSTAQALIDELGLDD